MLSGAGLLVVMDKRCWLKEHVGAKMMRSKGSDPTNGCRFTQKKLKGQVWLAPAESRVLLHNVSWETYESLLTDLEDCSAPRLTYDRGELEIMSPEAKHEAINEAVKVLVSVLCEERKLDVHAFGSTTFKREDT